MMSASEGDRGKVDIVREVARSKCGQGGRRSKNPKKLQTSYLEAPLVAVVSSERGLILHLNLGPFPGTFTLQSSKWIRDLGLPTLWGQQKTGETSS